MRKRLALIALSLLAVLLAAYLIVLNWIWAKPRGFDRSCPAGAGGGLAERNSRFCRSGHKKRRDGFVVHDRNAGENAVRGCRLPCAGQWAIPAEGDQNTERLLRGYRVFHGRIPDQQSGLPRNHRKGQCFRLGDQNRAFAGGSAVCLYHPAGFIEHRRFLRCGGRGNAVPIRKDRTKKCREVGVCTRNEKQKATASGF